MSYEIVRDRRFIKVGDNQFIPLILSGSNNCTQYNYVTGREILERNWNIYWATKNIITTKEEIFSWVNKYLADYVKDNREWFKWKTNWVCGNEIIKWIENGFKNAYTVEEYVKYANVTVKCEAVLYYDINSTSSKWERKLHTYCNTTSELLDWINQYNNFDKGDATNIYPNLEFTSHNEPLKLSKINSAILDNPYIVKVKNQYVSDYKVDRSISYCMDKTKAKVFTDKTDFDNLNLLCKKMNLSCKIVSADILNKIYPYYLKVKSGTYANFLIKKKTAASLKFTSSINDAHKFVTINEANKYLNSLIGKYQNATEFEICKID